MLQGFKAFIARGNVIDLAVAVIIGAAFGRIVTSLTDDLIMPLIGWAVGDLDFSSYFIRLGTLPANYVGDPNNYAALKAAGVPMIGYGQFATAAVHFLIVAFLIYLLIRSIRNMIPESQAADAAEVMLLREIRDELRQQRSAPSNPTE
ncbi:large conductance mechanosensitive channel protein MscL [Allosphingosinicella flava]|uniref:Large-conductance mechanosensitive channel n=1 Tax=Allosphingosinicella flava TaxID=2771430 RepID=A0A7T2GJ11_9SPHN|nr:large conductance mechanosensitive channel protein MscL [Sphingosinicella flava]QPQ54781.1 large conductance mechanosensitive channel protein MscL [Sphingosinicella flava]